MNVPIHLPPNSGIKWKAQTARGFTLIELLVVIAIIAILAAILMPVLSKARRSAELAQDMNNEKQLATGMLAFTSDNNSTYPPAAWQGPTGVGTVTWDTLLYNTVGGGSGASPSALSLSVFFNNAEAADANGGTMGLKVWTCPFDATLPKLSYMQDLSIRSYAMVSSGVFDASPATGLPSIYSSGFEGVGIDWYDENATTVNWNPQGYPETVVRHPSGTLMLVELSNSQNAAGNWWTSFCQDPYINETTPSQPVYQIDTGASTDPTVLAANGESEGNQLYPMQGNRFNYAFHDGHCELLQWQQTVQMSSLFGGKITSYPTPSGMWGVMTAH